MANWKSTIRDGDGFDSDNTRDWHFNLGVDGLEELTPTFIQDNWDDLQNKAFIGSKPNGYVYIDGCPQFDAVDGEPEYSNTDPSLIANELIVYTNAKAEQFCLLIMMWYKKILRGY